MYERFSRPSRLDRLQKRKAREREKAREIGQYIKTLGLAVLLATLPFWPQAVPRNFAPGHFSHLRLPVVFGQDRPVAPKIRPVVVYVTGEVLRPGVLRAPEDAKLREIIAAAGGYAPAADRHALDPDQPVKDGMHIHVPAVHQ